ncbi:MAG TPA: 50S ribosomal protein L25 [Anaerolineae bacterium]|nr:50S ribosomal protein L25 [Anaerolineae bacterium]
MDQIELKSAPRTVIGKQVKALRRTGLVPLVMYGPQSKPLALQADAKELARVLRQVGGSRLIAVQIGSSTQMALAREVQREPISGQILHVDLLAVSMTERIRVEVRLVLDGKAPAVRRGEGVLVTGVDAVEIECLPGDLIDSLHVDLEPLDKIGDALHVSDLKVPATVKILTEPEEMVARVTYLAAEEEVTAPAPAVEAAEPEVITRGKVEEEGEEE